MGIKKTHITLKQIERAKEIMDEIHKLEEELNQIYKNDRT